MTKPDVLAILRAALELAEDVMSRVPPFSNAPMWGNGMHPNTGISIIREALAAHPEAVPVEEPLYRKVKVIRAYAYRPKEDSPGADYTYWHPEYHEGEAPPPGWFRIDYRELFELAAPVRAVERQPIDMVLFCPACGVQHVDAPEDAECDGEAVQSAGWGNPPHRSHLCHGCGHIWRPADVPTNGVQAVKTKGSADSTLAAPKEEPPVLTQGKGNS